MRPGIALILHGAIVPGRRTAGTLAENTGPTPLPVPANPRGLYRSLRMARVPLICLVFGLAASGQTGGSTGWRDSLIADLCARYAACGPGDQTAPTRLDALAVAIGNRLTTAGAQGVPAEDVAKLALLLAQSSSPSAADIRPPDSPRTTPPGDGRTAALPNAGPTPAASGPAQAVAVGPATEITDMSKGQEGFRQGIEKLRELPTSERFVITGDISSGFQAATVPGASALTSVFGRARVNVVARAVPGSADGVLSDGHFFVQMQAAGGPFDGSPVGGPNSFSPLNDVATRRSRFNEGLSRGNLYLGKTFYQQSLKIGDGRLAGRIGLIDLSDFFDTNALANNESRQFLNSSLVNSAGYKAGFVAPGAMGEYRRKIDRDWLDGAVFRAGYAVSRTERAFTSPIWTGELELNTRLRGHRGNWRVGGTLGHVADVGSLHGIHISTDHWVSERIGVFGRVAWDSTGRGSLSLSPVHWSYSGGVQWRFVDSADRTSAFAVGFSQAFPINPDDTLSSERILESYYRWQFTKTSRCRPTSSSFWDPAAEAAGAHRQPWGSGCSLVYERRLTPRANAFII